MEPIIGGEFEFLDDVASTHDVELTDEYIMFSSGRAALYQLLKYAMQKGKADCVYLPDYICDSVYHVCEKLHLPYKFYSLTDNLQVDYYSLKSIYLGGGNFSC